MGKREIPRKTLGKWWFNGIRWDLPSGKRLRNERTGKIRHFISGKTHELSTGSFFIASLTFSEGRSPETSRDFSWEYQ